MSGFPRSLKSPSYLSPRRRPPMPGRTFSNSSERSVTSDDGADRPTSGRSTPTQAYQTRWFGLGPPVHQPSAASAAGPSTDSAPATREPSSSLSSSSSSRPISIDIPRLQKVGSATIHTPPEPLSARGDVPGGYFPMHEDPKDRVHRPHPFSNEGNKSRNLSVIDPEDPTRDRRTGGNTASTGAMGTANVPVASYFPTGYQDNALPMGKYYPSNYESAHNQGSRPTSASPTSPAGMSGLSTPSQSTGPDSEVRRKMQLQQYQRDMMTQASRAANEVLGTADYNKENLPHLGTRGPKGFAGKDMRFSGSSLHKPNAPRLHPLGSPGPVTPMELESSGSSYLDKGQADDRRPSQGLAPPSKGFAAQSL